MNKLKSLYYRFKVGNASNYYNFDQIPGIIARYGRFDNEDPEFFQTGLFPVEKNYLHAFRNGVGSTYRFIFNNLCIDVQYEENGDYITRMSIRQDSTPFEKLNGNGFPDGERMLEIFVDYLVKLPDGLIQRCFKYTHGAWDEYVYKNVQGLIDKVNSLTPESRYNVSYNGKPKQRKHVSCCK